MWSQELNDLVKRTRHCAPGLSIMAVPPCAPGIERLDGGEASSQGLRAQNDSRCRTRRGDNQPLKVGDVTQPVVRPVGLVRFDDDLSSVIESETRHCADARLIKQQLIDTGTQFLHAESPKRVGDLHRIVVAIDGKFNVRLVPLGEMRGDTFDEILVHGRSLFLL
jgi:hypothetical protein